MTPEPVRAGADWLALREPADAAARSEELVGALVSSLPSGRLVVHDLGSGSGSMARWLAPRLPGPQHWVMHDRDVELLGLVVDGPPGAGSDGTATTWETRSDDVTRLGSLRGAHLVTASALLDMVTGDELERLVVDCVAARCPVLLTLSVVGRVELAPSDPLDGIVTAAFNAHQRRDNGAGRLLGPDAAAVARRAFERHGLAVTARATPWQLGPERAALAEEWLLGWIGAACEQEPGLREPARRYARERLDQVRSGRLAVTVHHEDLLALPV